MHKNLTIISHSSFGGYEVAVKMSDEVLKKVSEEKVSDHEDVPSNDEAENDPKDATNKKKKKKKRNKGN